VTIRPANRNKDLAAIHVLATQLGMDVSDKHAASEYRATLYAAGGPAARRGGEISARFLDHVGRQRVIEHLAALVRARGIKRDTPLHVKPDPEWDWVNQASEDKRKMLWKIRALVRAAGIEPGKQKTYVEGVSRQMFRIERLELCAPTQLHKIVAALNEDARRRAAKESG